MTGCAPAPGVFSKLFAKGCRDKFQQLSCGGECGSKIDRDMDRQLYSGLSTGAAELDTLNGRFPYRRMSIRVETSPTLQRELTFAPLLLLCERQESNP
jgi:hypothetical protein